MSLTVIYTVIKRNNIRVLLGLYVQELNHNIPLLYEVALKRVDLCRYKGSSSCNFSTNITFSIEKWFPWSVLIPLCLIISRKLLSPEDEFDEDL